MSAADAASCTHSAIIAAAATTTTVLKSRRFFSHPVTAAPFDFYFACAGLQLHAAVVIVADVAEGRALACTLLLCAAAELLSSNANLERASCRRRYSTRHPHTSRVGEQVAQAVLACYAARALISDAHNCVLSRACLRNGFIRFPPCTATQSSDFTFLCAKKSAHANK